MARFGSRYLAGDFAVEKGFFYSFNVRRNRRAADSSRRVRVDGGVGRHSRGVSVKVNSVSTTPPFDEILGEPRRRQLSRHEIMLLNGLQSNLMSKWSGSAGSPMETRPDHADCVETPGTECKCDTIVGFHPHLPGRYLSNQNSAENSPVPAGMTIFSEMVRTRYTPGHGRYSLHSTLVV